MTETVLVTAAVGVVFLFLLCLITILILGFIQLDRSRAITNKLADLEMLLLDGSVENEPTGMFRSLDGKYQSTTLGGLIDQMQNDPENKVGENLSDFFSREDDEDDEDKPWEKP